MKKRSVEQAFSEAAPDYDAWVKQALPAYDELFSVAVESIPFAHERPLEIADLGAGSGAIALALGKECIPRHAGSGPHAI